MILFHPGDTPSLEQIRLHADRLINDVLKSYEDDFALQVEYGEADVVDVIRAYGRDMTKLQTIDGFEPDEYKQAGHLSFWIRKLKPLYQVQILNQEMYDDKTNATLRTYLNEIFSIYVAFAVVKAATDRFQATDMKELITEQLMPGCHILHDMRYRSITPYTLSNYLHLYFEKSFP